MLVTGICARIRTRSASWWTNLLASLLRVRGMRFGVRLFISWWLGWWTKTPIPAAPTAGFLVSGGLRGEHLIDAPSRDAATAADQDAFQGSALDQPIDG